MQTNRPFFSFSNNFFSQSQSPITEISPDSPLSRLNQPSLSFQANGAGPFCQQKGASNTFCNNNQKTLSQVSPQNQQGGSFLAMANETSKGLFGFMKASDYRQLMSADNNQQHKKPITWASNEVQIVGQPNKGPFWEQLGSQMVSQKSPTFPQDDRLNEPSCQKDWKSEQTFNPFSKKNAEAKQPIYEGWYHNHPQSTQTPQHGGISLANQLSGNTLVQFKQTAPENCSLKMPNNPIPQSSQSLAPFCNTNGDERHIIMPTPTFGSEFQGKGNEDTLTSRNGGLQGTTNSPNQQYQWQTSPISHNITNQIGRGSLPFFPENTQNVSSMIEGIKSLVSPLDIKDTFTNFQLCSQIQALLRINNQSIAKRHSSPFMIDEKEQKAAEEQRYAARSKLLQRYQKCANKFRGFKYEDETPFILENESSFQNKLLSKKLAESRANHFSLTICPQKPQAQTQQRLRLTAAEKKKKEVQASLPIIGSFCIYPSLEILSRYSLEDLSRVNHFQIWNQFGYIRFEEPVSVVKINLTKIFLIVQDCIQINDRVLETKLCTLVFKNLGKYISQNILKKESIAERVDPWLENKGLRKVFFDEHSGDLTATNRP